MQCGNAVCYLYTGCPTKRFTLSTLYYLLIPLIPAILKLYRPYFKIHTKILCESYSSPSFIRRQKE